MLLPLHMNMLLETAATAPGTPITNSTATKDVPKNYEICQQSGFRQYPRHDPLSKMRVQWNGLGVRAASLDVRHPQEFVKSRGGEPQRGPQSPEENDSFLATNEVTTDDL